MSQNSVADLKDFQFHALSSCGSDVAGIFRHLSHTWSPCPRFCDPFNEGALATAQKYK